MNIGKSIRHLRKEKGISQVKLCELCNISQSSLSQIEKGLKHPYNKTIYKICEQLGISGALLFMNSIEESDIPESKREMFAKLKPTIIYLLN